MRKWKRWIITLFQAPRQYAIGMMPKKLQSTFIQTINRNLLVYEQLLYSISVTYRPEWESFAV